MPRRGIIFAACVALFLIVGAAYYRYQEKLRHTFHVWFLDIGQGDSTLIQFENGQTMLVDCGSNKKVLSELGKVLPFYIRKIDYVLATHPDLDHYGGCVDVLKNYQVAHVVTNGRGKPNDTYWQTWDTVMHSEQAEVVAMTSPTVWMIAGDTLEFISPDPSLGLDTATDDSNNYSIVFRLVHGDKRFLFTGDMEAHLEKALIKKYCSHIVILSETKDPLNQGARDSSVVSLPQNDKQCPALQADVLKVGHHGSPGASSDQFVRLVSPQTAIISAGKNNRYHHPSLRVVRRLERVGTNVLRTDELGAILMQ